MSNKLVAGLNMTSESSLTNYLLHYGFSGGDKIPRKGGPGITQSDLLVINKTDLADAVGADLNVSAYDQDKRHVSSIG